MLQTLSFANLRASALSSRMFAPLAFAVVPGCRAFAVEVTGQMVKELRERTGAPIMDCKKALTTSEGDMNAAVEWLRKKGMASAQSKAGRTAAEGVVVVKRNDAKDTAILLELNSETDFVARTKQFQELGVRLADLALEYVQREQIRNNLDLIGSFGASLVKSDSGNMISVTDYVLETAATIRENMKLTRVGVFSVEPGRGLVCTYVHNKMNDNSGRIGTVVALETESKDTERLEKLGLRLNMQITASNVRFISRSSIPADVERYEKGILLEQTKSNPKEAGKPLNMLEKIIDSRFEKSYVQEVVLDEQVSLIDGQTKIKDMVANAAKEVGHPVAVKAFTKFVLAETVARPAAEGSN